MSRGKVIFTYCPVASQLDASVLAERIMDGDGDQSIGPETPTLDRSVPAFDPQVAKLMKAVDSQSLEKLTALLDTNVNVNSHGGPFHETPLHRASQERWAPGIRALLKAGATVYSKNQFGQTPLHYAAASGSTECVQLLLDAGNMSVLDHPDMRKHTPLHDAATVGCLESVKLLLKEGAQVGARDKNGESPLHKAAKARAIPCMLELLNSGGDLSTRDNSGESVLSYTLRHIPGGMEELLDSCIFANSNKLSCKNLEVGFNFVPVAGAMEKNQMRTLRTLVELQHRKLLSHPLCEAFLLLKWRNVRRLFFIEVIFYFIYAILTTLLTLNKFSCITKDSETTHYTCAKDINATYPSSTITAWFSQEFNTSILIIVLLLTIIVICQQVITMLQVGSMWLATMWHILHAIITVLVFVVLPGDPAKWQHHAATFLLLLLWTQCMLLIGRFPACGIYVVMFTRVAQVFMRIFTIYFCLLIAFSLSFFMAFHVDYVKLANGTVTEIDTTEDVFSNGLLTFFRTMAMMIGELDFGPEFANQLYSLAVTTHIIYFAFVILVAIILSNLLVALAVNDVQGLRNSAHLERLIKQMDLVFQMEENTAIVGKLADRFNLPSLSKLANICKHDSQRTRVSLLPYHPRQANRLLCRMGNIRHDVKVSGALVAKIMDYLRCRESEMQDKRTSVRVPSRRPRSEYNNNENITENLKQLETNLTDSLRERMEDMVHILSTNLTSRLATLEEKVALVCEQRLATVNENNEFMTKEESKFKGSRQSRYSIMKERVTRLGSFDRGSDSHDGSASEPSRSTELNKGDSSV